ncbi:hypothetical protein BpHYR1_015255 [Brachionus plicatilis]|uniref:Uncharacterized protein n=1 Tax=Brachionus plicatilis TaxID=10195 RepID=A0A3M7Q557_BRAPC|nr:hypothetical protein BpHYR1_015255 [Brachionus plicatilis]
MKVICIFENHRKSILKNFHLPPAKVFTLEAPTNFSDASSVPIFTKHIPICWFIEKDAVIC